MLKNKRLSLFMVMSVFVLFLSSCSARAAEDPSKLTEGYVIKSIDEIIDQELSIANFASDGSATLPIRTSIPVACSIVYGKSTGFGSLSLDQDMAGGTHSDHSPLLSGLEAKTEYYYRVQGVDDQGVLYLSDVMTFTTPIFEESETQNLASPELGAVITGYSSAFSGADIEERWGAGGAFDDNPNTEWSSAGDGDEAWIEVRLAQKAIIERVEFQSRSMSDGSAATLAFTITTEDGSEFGPFELSDSTRGTSFDTVIEGEVLRFNLMETTGGNTGVLDIAVFGQYVGDRKK